LVPIPGTGENKIRNSDFHPQVFGPQGFQGERVPFFHNGLTTKWQMTTVINQKPEMNPRKNQRRLVKIPVIPKQCNVMQSMDDET